MAPVARLLLVVPVDLEVQALRVDQAAQRLLVDQAVPAAVGLPEAWAAPIPPS